MDNWKEALGDLCSQRDKQKELEKDRAKSEYEKFIETKQKATAVFMSVIIPAFEELKAELEKHSRKVKIIKDFDTENLPSAIIIIESCSAIDDFDYIEEFSYKVNCSTEAQTLVDIKYMENKIIKEEFHDCPLKDEDLNSIFDIAREDIIESFMYCFERYI